jgi:hypothetical protein
MATHEDANLILKLYELRREEKLRQAREWFAGKFRPKTAQDVIDTLAGEHSAYLRMVTSYWEMVAALVNHKTIDMDLFCETTGEQFLVYARIEPFIGAMRTHFGNQRMFSNLEKLVAESPNGKEAVARFQARFAAEAAAAGASA